jgi:hypothetical protein
MRLDKSMHMLPRIHRAETARPTPPHAHVRLFSLCAAGSLAPTRGRIGPPRSARRRSFLGSASCPLSSLLRSRSGSIGETKNGVWTQVLKLENRPK